MFPIIEFDFEKSKSFSNYLTKFEKKVNMFFPLLINKASLLC